MSEFIRRIPFIGGWVEEFSEDDYKRRLKNSLRRHTISATFAIAFLSGVAAATGAGTLALVGEAWKDIDNWIDNLDDDQAEAIYTVLSKISDRFLMFDSPFILR